MGLENRQYYREGNHGTGPQFSLNNYSMITIIIVINVAIFILDTFTAKTGPQSHWLSGMMAVDSSRPWAIWTYLTSGFAHAPLDSKTSFMHVGGNMLTLFFLGRHVERRLGGNEFLKFYLLAILVSGIGFTAIRFATGQVPFSVLGASGGVSGVVALFVFMYPHEKLYFFGVIPMPAWVLGVLMVTIDFMRAFQPEGHVAWEAHLIGIAFGIAYFKFRWSFNRIDTGAFKKTFRSGPKLKVHNPGAGEERLKLKADLVLQKIKLEGEESLTPKERKLLNKYSNQLRKNRNDD